MVEGSGGYAEAAPTAGTGCTVPTVGAGGKRSSPGAKASSHSRPRWRRLGALALAGTLAVGGTALADFPDDPPNDPEYDRAEEDPAAVTCAERNVNEQRRDLFAFMPQCAPQAEDPENASGMSLGTTEGEEARGAWDRFSTGSGDTVIAYVEAGINWQDSTAEELANKVYVNKGELPPPTTPAVGAEECPPRARCAAHYSDTPDHNGNGLVDPEDLIVRYSDGTDDDGNGYVDDVSGWDFYDDQNDPTTYDSVYGHANGQMEEAAAEADNELGGLGICPDCMVLPIKAGAEALDRTDDLAQAWLFATDSGADVIVSVTADLGYSSFMRDAVDYAWERGVVMAEASNDFNSTDHQGGMFWPHVLPGNGIVSDSEGIPGPAANAATTTYRSRSNFSSWGTHNVFSGSTEGGTTSEATPTVGGVMAIVLAYGKEAARQDLIDRRLTGQEAIQVVRRTASDIDDPSLPWPGAPGFDLQYGYGRPNVLRAMRTISRDRIPPVGWIDSPRWYALFDPPRQDVVPIRGHVEAERARRYSWEVEFAPGAEPSDSEFRTAGRGSGSAPFDGRLGQIDLSSVPRSFWSRAFELSSTKQLETNERYTVTLRVRVTDNKGMVGEERRTIAVHRDPSWADGFPQRIRPGAPGGESQPQLADLRGGPALEIVFGDTDGRLHAIDGGTGEEIPGFPVETRRTRVTRSHRGVEPGREPILNSVAIGDLRHDGGLEIVAATTTGRVYVWDARGRLQPGWPKTLDRGVDQPPIPRPTLDFTRLPVQGASAPPVLHDLDGDRELEVIQSGWDGFVHVWRPSGKPLRGWPVRVTHPDHPPPPQSPQLVNDQKVDTPPSIADLDGDGTPELVVRSQYIHAGGSGLQPLPVSHLHAYEANGDGVAGFLVEVRGVVSFVGSAQEFITEGANAPVTADVDRDGEEEIAFAPAIFSPTMLFDGNGDEMGTYGPYPDAALDLFQGGDQVQELVDIKEGNLPTDTPVNFTTSGAYGRFGPGGGLSYAEPGSGASSVASSLLLPGAGVPINNYMRVHEAAGGANLPGFPSDLQGLDFLGAPTIADVTGDGDAEVVAGGDTSALHAYGTSGGQASGFPKFQTGWIVWGPPVGDVDADGRNEVVSATREGYLFAWDTRGDPKGNDEWWAYRHDERNTGLYGIDTRPPGKPQRADAAEASTTAAGGHPGRQVS
ncbi:MAG TPA: S8 family serine peptidase, partial [Thermoleophilaceae bacterium]|nr:S8 family serine peptidase [Thermoleophilaceae bacterium]